MRSSFTFGALLATAHAAQVSVPPRALPTEHGGGRGGRPRQPLQLLMESAKGMLKNGATPDVMEFAETTDSVIQADVLEAVLNEALVQQRDIWTEHGEFQAIKDSLAERLGPIKVKGQECIDLSRNHKDCRDDQDARCTEKRHCEGMGEPSLIDWWRRCEEEDREYDENHELLYEHFCPANGTTYEFRARAKVLMETQIGHGGTRDALAWCHGNYTVKHGECVGRHDALDEKTIQCNGFQRELETCWCSYSFLVQEARDAFRIHWLEHMERYADLVELVEADAADRRQEYTTLQVVRCLVNRVHELNGVPCDTATGVSDEISACEEGHSVDPCLEQPILCPHIPEPPPQPPSCNDIPTTEFNTELYSLPEPLIQSCTFTRGSGESAGRSFLNSLRFPPPAGSNLAGWRGYREGEVDCTTALEDPRLLPSNTDIESIAYAGGECLPLRKEYPCTSAYFTQEYASLPAVPQPPFSEHNPGCNAYPECGDLHHCDFEYSNQDEHFIGHGDGGCNGDANCIEGELYCHNNPDAAGCYGWHCCEDSEVNCLACQARRTPEDYCIIHGLDVTGCRNILINYCSAPDDINPGRAAVRWCVQLAGTGH